MREPLLGGISFVVDRAADDAVMELLGTVPGPAGSIATVLDGVYVALDAADLAVANVVRVPLHDAATVDPTCAATARSLVGERTLARALAAPADGRQRRIIGDGEVATPFTRFVLAAAGAEAPGLTALERALTVLDAGRLADVVGFGAGWRERLHTAATVVVTTADGADEWLDEPDARRLASDACTGAAALLHDELLAARLVRTAEAFRHGGDDTQDVRRLARDVRRGLRRRAPAATDWAVAAEAAAAPPAAAAPMAVGGGPRRHAAVPEVAVDALPALLTGQLPRIRRTTADEYELRLGGWAGRTDGWWARVVRASDQLPLAAVPVGASGADAVARFVLAPKHLGDVLVDIVDHLDAPRPPREAAVFRAAVAGGQRAARLERLGRGEHAVSAWRAAGGHYDAAADTRRAAMARAIADDQLRASRGTRRGTAAPVLADIVGPRP